jgi:hypothetical protein
MSVTCHCNTLDKIAYFCLEFPARHCLKATLKKKCGSKVCLYVSEEQIEIPSSFYYEHTDHIRHHQEFNLWGAYLYICMSDTNITLEQSQCTCMCAYTNQSS